MKVSAYGVHLLTAIGAALGLWALILTYNGFFREAMWVMGAAVLIDSIDGTLARKTGTAVYASAIDGALLDNIVDFLTWTIAPLFWAYAALELPVWVLLVCAVASAIAFSNVRAKTGDYFFLGFPSYWNIVVLFIYLLEIPESFSVPILLILVATCFIPIKFIYPSRTPYFKTLTLSLGVIFFVQLAFLVVLFDRSPLFLIYSSFIFPAYYFGLSFYFNIKEI